MYLLASHKRFAWPAERDLRRKSQRPIAILIPLWKEHGHIRQMLARNVEGIRYRNYHIFVGVYPNDTLTVNAVSEAAGRHARVHKAVVPHDGPTSKGDCLNWIYYRMREYERRHNIRFRVIMTHDAEDVIHPESLNWINWFSRQHQMVQIPVLPLPTPAYEWTHGLYCDEFAEFQTKDIPVRQMLGGFVPANGVGTGFAREAVERLAALRGGRPFDPSCLTEDYETGFEMHQMGYSQIFVPLQVGRSRLPYGDGDPCATREYFPRKFRSAISQRCRWVTGIALQGWERHGWRETPGQLYWFWRDRKGIVGNLLSPFANLVLVYGIARFQEMGAAMPHWLALICEMAVLIAMMQNGMRVQSAARIYGWQFAMGVPLRMVWGNLVNFAATARALSEFWTARWKGTAVAWRKTEHTYPVSAVLVPESGPALERSTLRSRAAGAGSIAPSA
jgi:adsorption protein B